MNRRTSRKLQEDVFVEQEEPRQTQESYTEYIPEDILQAAGICDRPFAIEQLRFELYELENDVAAGRGELAGMRRKWDGIKRSLRFSLIMLVVFFLLRRFMELLHQEQFDLLMMISEKDGTDLSRMFMIGVGADAILFFQTLFYSIDWIFLTRSLYKLFEFLCHNDNDWSRRLCGVLKKKNLSEEIGQYELRFMRLEERMRRLKQARTMYRERKQEEWRKEDLPERIAAQRELAEEE